jgi:hypothetical protein
MKKTTYQTVDEAIASVSLSDLTSLKSCIRRITNYRSMICIKYPRISNMASNYILDEIQVMSAILAKYGI